MAYEHILTERRGRVGILTLNRPEKLNAWHFPMHYEIVDAISRWNDDKGVGAIVITGAGRAFCAGADVSSFQSRIDAGGVVGGGEDPARVIGETFVDFIRGSKPIIAAINGVAVGIGISLLLPLDIRIASTNAKIGFFFVKMGMTPELESTYFLPQLVGLGVASELMLTARTIDGAEAQRIGLVNRLVEPDALLDTAVAIGEEIAANPSPQLRMIKDLLAHNAADADAKRVRARELDQLDVARKTPEHKEAVAAFMERRAPNFDR